MEVTLQRADGPLIAPADAPLPAVPTGYNVIVIDDEPLLVGTVARVLGGGNAVTGETDPAVGLQRILREPHCDAVLCDLMLPGLSGMDIYDRVRMARPGFESRIIFVTGGAYTARARAFLDSVPNPRLNKPFTGAELLAALRALSRRRL